MLNKKFKKIIFDYVDKQEELSLKFREWLKEYPLKFFNILQGITIFMLKFYILKRIFIDKIYQNQGFEMAILYLFVLYIVMTKINMKSLFQTEEEETKKTKK